MTETRRFSPQRLRSLFEPQSIALVGASDNSSWSMMVHNNLTIGAYAGRMYYINPRNPTVHGKPTVARLADIGEPVDLAYIMVPGEAVLPVVREMAEVGIHNAIVLTAGFAELGEEGLLRQQELQKLAQDHDIALLGPNCLGYVNLTRHIEAMPNTGPHPLIVGSVALLSQSGALAGMLGNYAHEQPVGLSLLVSTGNEAVLTISEVLEYAVEDEASSVIALFVETVRHPDRFIEAAQHAMRKGKPVVALKTGRGELSAKVAQAHTGALVGDDRVIEALFRQLGIMRVDSLEELLLTANVLAHTGHLRGNRIGYVGISGGGCDLAADYAEQTGLILPPFSEEKRAAARELLPALGPVHNPLDVTGAAITNRVLFGQLLDVLGKDPHLDVLLCQMSLPREEAFAQGFVGDILAGMADSLRGAPVPAFMIDALEYETNAVGRALLERVGLPFLPGGLQRIILALGKGVWWANQHQVHQAKGAEGAGGAELHDERPVTGESSWSEWRVRAFLEEQGIPLVPARLVTSTEQAVTAAQEVGFPVALKIVSPDILHKSDIGGVQLNLRDEEAVRQAFTRIMAAAQVVMPAPHIEGALVSPMREAGIELLVGVVRDSVWGQVMAVGLGGIWVEILKDSSLRVLPVSRHDVYAMLDELQGKALLQGARGSRSADLDALVEVIYRVSRLAQALESDLEALEINPLRVDGSQIEALDAMVTWRKEKKGKTSS
jgi:acyl-CoA synthetase (NDP forming)